MFNKPIVGGYKLCAQIGQWCYLIGPKLINNMLSAPSSLYSVMVSLMRAIFLTYLDHSQYILSATDPDSGFLKKKNKIKYILQESD